MITLKDAQKLWAAQKAKFAPVRSMRTAVLGDGRGQAASNITVPNADDYVWARESIGATNYFPTLNRVGVPLVHNLPVILGYADEEPNIEQVLRIYTEGLGGLSSGSALPTTSAHHQQHEFGGGDEVEIEGRLFTPGRVSPTDPPSMSVVVAGFTYYYNGWNQYAGETTPLLTQYRPASGYNSYLLIAFDPVTEQLVYRPGLPYADGSNQDIDPSFEDVPAPSGDEYPLGYVFMTGTTTVVDWTNANDNIGDARLHIGFPARKILERLDQLEGYTGNDPSLATTGAAASSVAHNPRTLATLYTLGASDISGASAIGVSESAAPGDHVHRGVQSLNVPGNALMFGGVNIESGTGTTVTQSGTSILISASGGGVGVSSINVAGASPLQANVYLIGGGGASLSQSGASITIGLSVSNWSSAVQTPSRSIEVVYTNGNSTRLISISLGLSPGSATAQASLFSGPTSAPSTEVARVNFLNPVTISSSAVTQVHCVVLPNEYYWLRQSSGSVNIINWLEYNDPGGGATDDASIERLAYTGVFL